MDKKDFELIQMDTNNLQMTFSAESMDEVVRKHLLE